MRDEIDDGVYRLAETPSVAEPVVFAGPKSQTVDREKLAQAQDQHFVGVPREKTWADTGFFADPRQQFWYEIPDDKMEFDSSGRQAERDRRDALAREPTAIKRRQRENDALERELFTKAGIDRKKTGGLTEFERRFPKDAAKLHKAWSTPIPPREPGDDAYSSPLPEPKTIGHLQDFVRHDDLRAAYPEAFDQTLFSTDTSSRYSGESARGGDYTPPWGGNPGVVRANQRNVVGHELGHFAQEQEQAGEESSNLPFATYSRMNNEWLARIQAARLNMPSWERAVVPPWKSADMPDNELFGRREGGQLEALGPNNRFKKLLE